MWKTQNPESTIPESLFANTPQIQPCLRHPLSISSFTHGNTIKTNNIRLPSMSILLLPPPPPPLHPFTRTTTTTRTIYCHQTAASCLLTQSPQTSEAESHSKQKTVANDEESISSSSSYSDLVYKYSEFLHSCISNKDLIRGQKLHLHLTSKCTHLLRNPTIQAKLITLYSVCQRIHEAERVFETNRENPSVWTAMLTAYTVNGFPYESLWLFAQMQHHCLLPHSFAVSSALKACTQLSQLRLGRAVHAQIVKLPECCDAVVENALVALYVKLQVFKDARRLFEVMTERDLVSWNSMITGFVEAGFFLEALNMFRRMQREGIGFNWVTLTVVLPACARSVSLQRGKEIHAQMIKAKKKSCPDVSVQNSLMDMYAKCGEIDRARRLFDRMHRRDISSWNVMIGGYSINGSTDEALNMLNKMVISSNVKPDGITFIAVLSGCSHAGYVEEGLKLFARMKSEFRIEVTVEHYSCMVDMLGRAGRMNDVAELVRNMPMTPSKSVWGSLLNSCRMHGNMELAEKVAHRLFELEPDNAANYVLLANVYSTSGRQSDADGLRKKMEEKGIKKDHGRSWIQIGSGVHTFTLGSDHEFYESEEFKELWAELKRGAEEEADMVVPPPLPDELQDNWVCGHSERIALAYGLINTGASTKIRITKNLRVCIECHTVIKIVSRVAKRVVVLRDGTRLHHFKDGMCSCRDCW